MDSDARLDALPAPQSLYLLQRGRPLGSHLSGCALDQRACLSRSLSTASTRRRANPALNCAGLIVGEVGSGKTHLLGRILTQRQQTRFPCAFAYIQPLEDPEQTYRYLLREVMVNLFHPMAASPQATQFRRLVTRVFQEG